MNPYEPPQTELAARSNSEANGQQPTTSVPLRFVTRLMIAVVVCFGLWCIADYVYVHEHDLSDIVGILAIILASAATFILGISSAYNSSIEKKFALGLLMIAINFVIQLFLVVSLGLAFHFAIGGSL